MAFKPLENEPGRGVMFHREVEEGSKRPDLSGGFNWKGQEFRISGWTRTSKNGKEYISLAIEVADSDWQQRPRAGGQGGKGRWEP